MTCRRATRTARRFFGEGVAVKNLELYASVRLDGGHVSVVMKLFYDGASIGTLTQQRTNGWRLEGATKGALPSLKTFVTSDLARVVQWVRDALET